ncbi:MAG: CHAT domain-containing tetratricopeptide repeat protein [Bacteroidota bacterium]
MRSLSICLILLLLTGAHAAEGQVLKRFGNKLKEKAGSTFDKSTDESTLFKAAFTALRKSHAKKDSTSMNLALSSYDNVSFYSDRKGAENVLRYMSTLIGEVGGYEFDRADEGKSTSEMLGISNPFGKNKSGNNSSQNSYSTLSDEQYQLLKQAETLNQTGELSYSSRLYEYAKASFKAAAFYLSEDPKLELSLLHAKIKSNLGMVHHSLGDFQSSEAYFEEALDIMGQSGVDQKYLYAVVANNQAILLKDLGQFNRAEAQFKGVIAIFDELGESGIKASLIARNNLAILYQYLGRTSESIALLEEITDNTSDWGERSNSYQRVSINLALIYESVGNTDAAETIYLKAIEIKKKQRRTNQPDYASILTNLASLYFNNGQLEKDITGMLEEARTIYEKQYGESHPTLVTVNDVEIAFLIKTEDYGKAKSLAEENDQITSDLYGEKHPKRNKAVVQLAVAAWKNQETDDATRYFQTALDNNMAYIKTYFPAMSEVEKGKYWQTLQPDFHAYYSFAFANPTQQVLQKALQYEIGTKGLLLSTSGKIRKQILESGDRELIQNYQSWKSAKNQLAYYYSVPTSELKKQKINLDSIATLANEKERWLSANTAVFSEENKNVDFQVKDELSDNEALIDVIKYQDYDEGSSWYQALIVDKTNYYSVKIGEAPPLDQRMIKLYKNSIIFRRQESKSYQAFWAAIHDKVYEKEKVYIVKDGVYNQISIGSLFDGSRYLAEQYDITVITNPADIKDLQRKQQIAKSIFLMGSPAFNSEKYDALPGTLSEVNSIEGIASSQSIPTTKFTETEATEKNFSKATEAEVLHVATHGFFIEKKDRTAKSSGENLIDNGALDALMRSGIVLADQDVQDQRDITDNNDGLVTAYEITTMDFPDTEIVVLSACETGLGEIKTGEGVYGLQRSFLVAGARSVIMSLWKVDDKATKEFMINFYNNWLSTGDKHEAFNQARRNLKTKYESPYYWGAFILIEG